MFRALRIALHAGCLALIALAVCRPAMAQVTFAEYTVPTPDSDTYGIAVGTDGNLWFTEVNGNKIGRITTAGTITEFPIPTPVSGPGDIVAGADGNLWFTENRAGRIGRITPTGTVTEFTIPSGNSYPYGICAGPDGNLWFTETGVADGSVGPIGGNNIGRITTTGGITEFPIPTPRCVPQQITTGPDGNLWFAEGAGKIARITTTGVITEFPVPNAEAVVAITNGPDGNLWFGEYRGGKIGRITTGGTITEFTIPNAGSYVNGITTGPDGNLWFVEAFGTTDQIAMISTAGAITEYPIPTAGGVPLEIVTGPDGSLWFTEQIGKIGKATLSATPSYTINPLYDQTRAVKRGACYPIKLQILDAHGANVSSAAITVQAITVTLASTDAPGALEDVGNANPDNDFRYDAALGGYIFNLSTAGLYTGTWNLHFTAGNDPTVYTVQFQIK